MAGRFVEIGWTCSTCGKGAVLMEHLCPTTELEADRVYEEFRKHSVDHPEHRLEYSYKTVPSA